MLFRSMSESEKRSDDELLRDAVRTPSGLVLSATLQTAKAVLKRLRQGVSQADISRELNKSESVVCEYVKSLRRVGLIGANVVDETSSVSETQDDIAKREMFDEIQSLRAELSGRSKKISALEKELEELRSRQQEWLERYEYLKGYNDGERAALLKIIETLKG